MRLPFVRVRRADPPNLWLMLGFFIFAFAVFCGLVFSFVKDLALVKSVGSFRSVGAHTVLEQKYRTSMKSCLSGLFSVDYASSNKDAVLKLLTATRQKVLAVSGVPSDFKNAHLFTVLTLDKMIDRVKAGDKLNKMDLSDFISQFRTLYEAL